MDNPNQRTLSHQVGSDKATNRLVNKMGLSLVCQQKLGALLVYMGTFERHIELAAWAILEIGPSPGTRPITDKIGVMEIVDRIRRRPKARDGTLSTAIDTMCDAADDLIAYRNAIAHGWLFPSSDETPYFISNSPWHDEVRARPIQDAHISENLLDAALDAALTICGAAVAAYRACSGPNSFDPLALADYISPLRRAKSGANELRHLTELMNHEKY